ncbi:DMT family transporter [Amorphus orientalis]|uniref:Drug/metabolite transporter (DMT)-like permease n=1 Tax=Amorphus orientalis TaxID=649198 RepID=A0AAE3VRG8_9HYPH|nr:DMT family transporter [Amorphus orientalis]MDQ0316808.1 drug/metabolite transporter (DMT)-like permease [Amorphus orientalis]
MTITPPSSPADTAPRIVLALVCLVAGAVAMGVSPVFVRNADVGPFTSAFWRVALSLPVLWLWARLEARNRPADAAPQGWSWPVVLTGLFFAGDLLFWHLAIVHTTVANATFLATMAPVWVILASGLVIREPVGRESVIGLGLCLVGAALLIGMSYSLAPGRVDGDIYGVVTSMFFGAYFLSVRVARRTVSPGFLMFRSGIVTAAVLLIAAVGLEGQFLPGSATGIAALLALALVSHAGGQGLLSFSLGHLTAAFSSLVIFLEALAAALAGWVFLGEALSLHQAAGGAAILAGIWLARPRTGRPRGSVAPK